MLYPHTPISLPLGTFNSWVFLEFYDINWLIYPGFSPKSHLDFCTVVASICLQSFIDFTRVLLFPLSFSLSLWVNDFIFLIYVSAISVRFGEGAERNVCLSCFSGSLCHDILIYLWWTEPVNPLASILSLPIVNRTSDLTAMWFWRRRPLLTPGNHHHGWGGGSRIFQFLASFFHMERFQVE